MRPIRSIPSSTSSNQEASQVLAFDDSNGFDEKLFGLWRLHFSRRESERRKIVTDQRLENLFAELPTALPEELVEVLAENRNVRIERIVSTGHASAEGSWYDQDQNEWVVVRAKPSCCSPAKMSRSRCGPAIMS